MADQIGDRAGHFHAGGTGANQDKRQQVAMTAGVFLSLGLLERPEDLIPNRYGVGQAFQSRSILLKFIVPEVIMACACSQNQVVKVDPHVLAVHSGNQNALFIRVYAGHFPHDHNGVRLVSQYATDVRTNLTGG